MSDRLESLFAELRGQHPPAPFAPAEAVRRRGRQRSRRRAVSVAVAVVVMLAGGGAGWASTVVGQAGPVSPAATSTTGPPHPSSAPSGSPPSSPDEVPAQWLLTAADLGPGQWRQASHELLEGEWFWGDCERFRAADARSLPDRVGLDVVSWVDDGAPLPTRVSQVVERFDTSRAAVTNLTEVRDVVRLCSRRPQPGDVVAPTHREITDAGFAGDESLLVRQTQYYFDDRDEIVPAGEFGYIAVVRVGQVVTTLVAADEPLLREAAGSVAHRLE